MNDSLLTTHEPETAGFVVVHIMRFAGDKIVVPISAIDVGNAMRPTFECCKGHGAVALVDAATGKVLWTWHTMEQAKPLGRKNSQGVDLYGPSGAPIWSSPSVDLKKGVVYTATGENTSPPATGTSDSLVAIDLATGKQKWVFQALANDVWNMSCPVGPPAPGTKLKPNCFFAGEGSVMRDHDFGGGPVIWRGKGKELILGGQKSGDVWAVDSTTGKQVWRHQFGKGSPLGGVHWGIATDGTRVFAPIADPGVPAPLGAAGLYAVDIASGKVAWEWKATPGCDNGRKAKVPGIVATKGAHVHLVDQSTVRGIDIRDGLHPNDFGYAKMSWNWFRAMAPVYGVNTARSTAANPYALTRGNFCHLVDNNPGPEWEPYFDCRWYYKNRVGKVWTWQTKRLGKWVSFNPDRHDR